MMTQIDLRKFNKIIIVGSGGAGKSYFAKRLAEKAGHPLFHLDNEYWQHGWEKPPRGEWVARQRELILGERWVIDGNYNSTMELRFAAAELVILLDINRLVCMWSAARRTGKKRSDLPDYLDEPCVFNREFLEFCKWIWEYPKTGRKTVLELHEKYPEVRFLRIKNRRALRRLLTN